ncbi:sensor domain-containing diguanylate cyclase [candidate division KSB1 bacterium]|nr:sensor domain-containing diguanylate cyclase [candidate division KSB1 bacterium]
MAHSISTDNGNMLGAGKKRKGNGIPAMALGSKRLQPQMALAHEMAKRSNNTHDLFLEYYCRFKILSTLSEQMDVERTLKVIKKVIRKNFPAQQFSLMLIDESGSELLLRSHFGLSRRSANQTRYPLNGNIFGEALKRRRHIYLPQVQDAAARHQLPAGISSNGGAFLALPLIGENGRVVGMLSLLRRRPGSFTTKEIELLRKIAGQIGQVIDTIFAYQHTRELSYTDELTRVFNRRYFNQRFEREMQRAQRYGRALSLIMLDIDHFKAFNDTHGHLWGDTILKQVAQILEKSLRKADILARFGGEEFVVLLPEIDKEHGRKVAEKLRRAIERTDFPKAATQPLGRLTISLGFAAFPEDAKEAEALVDHADQGLYLAKSRGRNQVGVYQENMKKLS